MPGPDPTPRVEPPVPPADPDGDAIVGAADACPDEAEVYNNNEDEDGCPDCASRIIVSQAWSLPRVYFSVDTSTPTEDRPLDQLAAILLAHPEKRRTTISAHLGKGEPASLRDARANVVLEALLARGVPRERLEIAPATARDQAAVELTTVDHGPSRPPLCHHPFPGCSSEQLDGVMVTDRVFFARGSPQPRPIFREVLEAVAATVAANTDVGPLEVRGHAAPGERAPAQLALARATAVADVLVAAGVPRDRLVVRALGIDRTVTRREEARRVDFGTMHWAACSGRPPRP